MSQNPNGYVVAVGTACMDEYYELPRWLPEGDKAVVRKSAERMGGMIPNAACVLSRLGTKTYLVDTMNSSSKTAAIRRDLEEYGVDTSAVLTDPSLPDVTCMIYLTPRERTVFAVDGCKPDIPMTEELTELFLHAGAVYTTPYNWAKIVNCLEVARLLKQHSVKLVFDVESVDWDDLSKFLLPMASVVFFNQYGYEAYGNLLSSEQPAKSLLRSGVETVAVTQGKYGCTCYTGDGEFHVQGLPVPVVDPTGAGDTFNAAFLSCYLSGQDAEASARFATMAAARSITLPGPRGGAATQKEIFSWYANFAKERNL